MVVAGPDVLYEYGRFVGARFAGLDNIIWLDGGDYTPPNDDLDLVRAVRDGIVDAGATQLRTAHWSPETSAADVDVDWLDFNTTYTYGPVYLKSSSDEQVPSLPHIVLESQYEQDIWDNTSQRVRSQIYEAVLTGAAGSIYGHGDVWQYTSGWRDALDEPGAVAMTRARQLFDSLPWSDLVPDVRANAVVANIGEFGDERVVVAAATPDRTTVVAYVPDERDVAPWRSRALGVPCCAHVPRPGLLRKPELLLYFAPQGTPIARSGTADARHCRRAAAVAGRGRWVPGAAK